MMRAISVVLPNVHRAMGRQLYELGLVQCS